MQTKFLMQLNLIIYLFYYFFIVSSCLNIFLIRNDQQKKNIYILIKHHKNNSVGNLIISVFLIFSLSFLNVKRSYFTKKTPLSANTLLAKKPTGDCYSKN